MVHRSTSPRQLALDLTMTPDERTFFEQLGKTLAQARNTASLTQQQVADSLGIPQPQYASYEVGRRRVPVSLLPGLARLFSTSIDALIGEDGMPTPGTPAPRRTKRGPPSRLERQLDAVAQLPKGEQKMVSELIDAMLTRYHAQTGQEAAPAP